MTGILNRFDQFINKFAFQPPSPSYEFVKEFEQSPNVKLTFKSDDPNINNNLAAIDLNKIEAFYLRDNEINENIACAYIRCVRNPKYTILFSHGNAQDLGQMSFFLFYLGSRLGCNMVTYDYTGYGASSGKINRKCLTSNIESVWSNLKTKYNLNEKHTILYGFSLGSVPTVHLATQHKFAGVILHSALMSALRVITNTKRSLFFDFFRNIDNVDKIGSKVLVIHGLNDQVINAVHGFSIYNKCENKVDPLWIKSAGHNDIFSYEEYYIRLENFILMDLIDASN